MKNLEAHNGKPAPAEGNSFRDFIKMKKAMKKEEKNNEQCFSQLRQQITSSDYKMFQQEIGPLKPLIVFNFLFSEDQLKNTPLHDIFSSKEIIAFLKIINEWSSINAQLLQKQLGDTENGLKAHDWEIVYVKMNRKIADLFSSIDYSSKDRKEILQLLGDKNSIFHILSKVHLNFSMIIQTAQQSLSLMKVIEQFYYPLLKETALSQMTTLLGNVESYLLIVKRDNIWGEKQFIKYVTEHENINPAYLELKELEYNFWHELAVNDSVQMFKVCDLLVQHQINEITQQQLEALLMQIDRSGEMPLDKCLRLWDLSSIKKLLGKYYSRIPTLMLTSSCLNKILINRKLKQKDKEELLKICLSGQMTSKFYAKILREKKQIIQPKVRKIKGQNSSLLSHKKYQSSIINTINYTFSICYNNIELKITEDSFGLYPLATYLTHYKDKANLQTIEMLWLNALSKKDIKKLTQLFIREQQGNDLKISRNTNAYKDLQLLYNFYQPIWKAMTYMKHGQVLEYLIAKCPVNIFQVQLLSKGDTVSVNLFGPHFIRFYIINNPFKGEDQINKTIIQNVLNCKQKEKSFGQFHLYLQLIRSLADLQDFHSSEEFFVKQIKKTLVAYFNSLSNDDYFIKHEHWSKPLILEWVCNPLFAKKIKKSVFLTLEDLVQKIGEAEIYKFVDNPADDQSSKLHLYSNLLKNTGRPLRKVEDQSLQFDPPLKVLQNMDKKSCQCGILKYIPCKLSVNSCKLGFFRLKPNEKSLEKKISTLLKQSLDVYFSRFSKGELYLDDIKQQLWKKLITRMHKEHCSFLQALISQPTVTFNEFKEILTLSTQQQNKQLKYLLFDRIFISRIVPSFVQSPQPVWNIDFLIELVKLGNHLFQESRYPFVETITTLFTQNVNKFLQEIIDLTPSKANKNDKQSPELIHKKKEFEQYLLQWIPKISKLGTTKEENQNIFQRIVLPLMESCQRRNLTEHCTALLKSIDFSLVLIIQISLKKLAVTDKGDKEYVNCLQSCQWQLFSNWLQYFSMFSQKPLLKKALSQFRPASLFQLLEVLLKRNEQLEKYIQIKQKEQKFKLADSKFKQARINMMSMILTVFRTIPTDNTIEAFLKIKSNQCLQENIKQHTRSMLMSANNIATTTAALIFLDPKTQLVFYLKENGQTKKYTNVNFYSQCSNEFFQAYLKNLQKYHTQCPNLQKHLQIVCHSLLELDQLQRLNNFFNIKIIQKFIIKMILKGIYDTSNRKIKIESKAGKTIVQNLFANYKSYKLDWDESSFTAAYYLNYSKAMELMKPSLLSLKSIKKCIQTHPEGSKLLFTSELQVDKTNLPQSKHLKAMFPFYSHYVYDYPKLPWLIDQLRFQNKLLIETSNTDMLWLYRTKQSWRNQEAIFPIRQQFYQEKDFWQAVCTDILTGRKVKQLKIYEKYCPSIKQIIKKQIINSGVIMNLQMVHPQLLAFLIKENILSSQNPNWLFKIFLRILKTSNLQILQSFLSTNKITLTLQYLKSQPQISFLKHFFSSTHEKFLIEFITKYKLFDLYPLEEWSPILLKQVCSHRLNKLLRFTIAHCQSKYKIKPTFVAAIEGMGPKITEKAVFYLPIQEAIAVNFYQCYFLIKGSQNQCPQFKVSRRFISKEEHPEEWSYIPEFSRRIKINNALMTTISEAVDLDFRTQVILPSIFELEVPNLPKCKQPSKFNKGDDDSKKPAKKKAPEMNRYTKSLCRFINNIVNNSFQVKSEGMGVLEKLSLMTLTASVTKIPEEELKRIYPSEMQVINCLKEFINGHAYKEQPIKLVQQMPEFRPLLLQYNPSTFLSSPILTAQMSGIAHGETEVKTQAKEKTKIDYVEYLRGVQVNLSELETKHQTVLKNFIGNNFFTENPPLFDPFSSLNLKREVLILLLLDLSLHQRKWDKCVVYQMMNSQQNWTESQQEYMLYLLALQLNSRVENKGAFDLLLWNKMLQEILLIQASQKQLKQPQFSAFSNNEIMISNYASILASSLSKINIICSSQNLKAILNTISSTQKKKCRPEGIFLEFSLLMNVCFLESQCRSLAQQLKTISGGSNITSIEIIFGEKNKNYAKFKSSSELLLQAQCNFDRSLDSKVVICQLSTHELLNNLRYDLYFLKLKSKNEVIPLNQFCRMEERHTFFKNYSFQVKSESFKSVKDIDVIERMFEEDRLNGGSIASKVRQDIEKMEERLQGFRNIKLYNMSDIYGPINFHEETNDTKIIECLSFYELLPFPKDKSVSVSFKEKLLDPKIRNAQMVDQLRKYFTYYIKSSRDEPTEFAFDNEVIVYATQSKQGVSRMQISWELMSAWTVADLTSAVLRFCSQLGSKIQQILDVRISFEGLLNYYQQRLKMNEILTIRESSEKLLFGATFQNLLENILLMITEDIRNIMSIVKGIIIRLGVNQSRKEVANVVLSQSTSVTAVEYEVREHLLYLTFQLKMKDGLNKDKKSDDIEKLVSRKEFLDSVFVSAQFLTDYFLLKNELNADCLSISTSISKRLNDTVHFHIEYSNLYKYIDNMRKNSPIRDIEAFLSRLKHYLHSNMERTITHYLSSPALASQHQILLLNKCEAVNTKNTLSAVEAEKQLIYQTQDAEERSGLKQIPKIMAQIGSDENVKHSFLIQVYKSYYSTLVAEGMTFVVGYQSTLKKAEVVRITKSDDIKKINVVELDFLLLVSKTVPSTDELNPSKIIRLFMTDANKNLYKLNSRLQNYLLSLPPESDERNMAHFAPLIPSSLKLAFNLAGQAKEMDTKDTKVFIIELPSDSDKDKDYKLKMRPSPDALPSPINMLKKSYQFKDAINRLKESLVGFVPENLEIVVDPPKKADEATMSAQLDHIISLASSDLSQMLGKFEYDILRNRQLDCKLSVEKELLLNQNAIVELRKRCFLKHYKRIVIRLEEGKSKITFEDRSVVLNVSYKDTKVLPSSSEYLSAMLQNLIKKEMPNLPKVVTISSSIEHESAELLLKLLDTINIIEYQLQEITTASNLLKVLEKKNAGDHEIVICRKKAGLNCQKKFTLNFNLETVDREFYPAEQIIQTYYKTVKPEIAINQSLFSFYSPENNQIDITGSQSKQYRLFVVKDEQIKQINVGIEQAQIMTKIQIKTSPTAGQHYFLIDDHFSVTSNYFFKYQEEKSVIRGKHHEGIIDRENILYLRSTKPIDLNTSTITATKKDVLNKENTVTHELCHAEFRSSLKVQLIASNVYRIVITSKEAAHYVLHFGGLVNPFSAFESANVLISSDSEMDLNCTKFVELELFKKKPVLIKEKNNNTINEEFRETSQVATAEMFEPRIEEGKVLENLVYVINDDCKRFLTRAGELRTDFIQLCDSNHNPINYTKPLDIKLVHVNRLAIVEPEIVKRGMQLGLKWVPTVRGHYYLYINKCLMNPTYEIGVCAGQADHITSKVSAPKVTKICFCEESQLMFDLRDSYGNIYSQLQEEILGDQLLIDLEPNRLGGHLKVEKSQINKYGLKKVKFNFNYTEGQDNTAVKMEVLLNREPILQFNLEIEGYSLQQRKKLLDKDIAAKDKRYYKELQVNRARFLEDIIGFADKSLHSNLTIRFVNEPGIDAGGVKREFYDLIGNQMKSEKNPFFRLVNAERMEYFLNPDLLKNKKKLEYMEVWGKYLANAFLNTYLIGMAFSPVFVKMLYEQSITYEDLLEVSDEDERKRYSYILTASPQQFEDLCLFFTAVVDKKKAIQIELKPGGKEIAVTAENAKEYLQLTADVLLTKRYKEVFEAFRKGFETVIELEIIKKWIRPNEFWCLTAGTKEITAELVLKYITFSGNNIQSISGWFRRYINEASREILVNFLKFSSGSSSIDFSLNSKVTVTFESAGENPKKLPISHTCWKEIVVPKYKSYEIMHKLLNAAFIFCSEGFGFG